MEVETSWVQKVCNGVQNLPFLNAEVKLHLFEWDVTKVILRGVGFFSFNCVRQFDFVMFLDQPNNYR